MEVKDMTIADVEERLAQIEVELGTESADVDALSAEVDSLQARRAAIMQEAQEKRDLMNTVAAMKAPVIEAVKEEKIDMTEERKALAEAYAEVIKGTATPEQRALMTTDATGGTVAISDIVDNYVWTDWEKSPILSRMRKVYIKGDYTVQYEVSATGAEVHEEGGETPDEEALVLGSVPIKAQYLKKWIKVTDRVLALRGQEFLDYLYDEFGHQLALAVQKTALEAAGMSSLTVNGGTATSVTTAIVEALAQLSAEALNPVAIMNRKTWARIAAFRTTTGDKIVDPFEGLEVIFSNDLTDDGILVGDLDGIVANFPEGEEFKYITDPYTYAEDNMVKIVGKILVGIGLARPHGFVAIELPAGDEDGE